MKCIIQTSFVCVIIHSKKQIYNSSLSQPY